jgi:hypothetical protein
MSIDNVNTDFDLNDLKISKNQINLPNADSIGYTILNNFDITPEIVEVNNYSIDFLIQFSNMIRFGYNFVQDSFFNVTSTQYTVIFTAISIVILFSIILFSKNKPKDIFILVYFGLGFVILLAIKFVLKFLMICFDNIIALLNHFKTLWKRRDEFTRINSFKDFFYFIYNFGGTFFSIMITLFLLAISLMIAGVICIIIQVLFYSSNSLFNAISGMSDDSTDMAQTVRGTFGSAFKESMERL